MKIIKKYAMDFECLHRCNLDNKYRNEFVIFEVVKEHDGHKCFRISLEMFNYLIFYINFYLVKESRYLK
jgi:hypothetical protein